MYLIFALTNEIKQHKYKQLVVAIISLMVSLCYVCIQLY